MRAWLLLPFLLLTSLAAHAADPWRVAACWGCRLQCRRIAPAPDLCYVRSEDEVER